MWFLLMILPSVIGFSPGLFQQYGLPVSEPILERYGYFSPKLRSEMRDTVREMFYHGYNSYMEAAWPLDELNPINCSGRGPDWIDPSHININDVLGNYSLTLVDSLDSLLVFGNVSEFQRATRLVIDHVSFDQDTTVQVFEATIRVMGGLLSAHLLLIDAKVFHDANIPAYNNELLDLAVDLADRLLDAFMSTETGLPHPRINLRYGVQTSTEKIHETCLAGAGSLMLEFGLISHLTGEPMYAQMAQKSVTSLWNRRSEKTGLFGNTIDIRNGQWMDAMSGVGAGMDSFYEYLLKTYVIFGDDAYLEMWNEIYGKIKLYERIGGLSCGSDSTGHPLYVNAHMDTGSTTNVWVDSLGASFPAVQVLAGDMREAICFSNFHANLWELFGGLPERFNWHSEQMTIPLYPLRPEMAESTYFLYRATKNPFYLHMGKRIVDSLNAVARTNCGFATVHDLKEKTLEDRMESFFLSETLKYLYLLFDEDNPVNRNEDRVLFTTEGHIVPLSAAYQKVLWKPIGQTISTSGEKRNVCPSNNPLLRFALPVDLISWKTDRIDATPVCAR